LRTNTEKMQISASQLAAIIDGSIEGDAQVMVSRPAPIETATTGDFTFLDSVKYEQFAYQTQAGILLVSKDFQPTAPITPTLIRVSNVREALAKLLELVQTKPTSKNTISPDARVAPSAQLADNVGVGMFSIVSDNAIIGIGTLLMEQVYIGAEVKIGRGCVVHQGAKIHAQTVIGNHCIIKSNAVIGSEGFGFAPLPDGTWKKVPQVGNVIVGNHVEIGANTCIDRGAIGPTIIADGAKLDNLIQIAHNVRIGENTAMAAQVGVAGSAEIGANCLIGGQAGIAGHIRVADDTKVQAQSGIAGNIKQPNTAIFGSPAIPYADYVKAYLVFKNLPEMERRLRALERNNRS
jgi:UDP-3-O-[3-hydroxymyristoyl] glucosamine N-acyltransferase